MTLINDVIENLLQADPDMTIQEIEEHCIIIGNANGLSRNEIRKQFQNCEKIREMVNK